MKKLRITVGNKTYDVTVEELGDESSQPAAPPPAYSPATPLPPLQSAPAPQRPAASGAVASPMSGVIKSILVQEGQSVDQGQPLLILEAMKMDNQITAPVAATVKAIQVATGDSVQEGHTLLVLE